VAQVLEGALDFQIGTQARALQVLAGLGGR
jgi:hypothetical protein